MNFKNKFHIPLPLDEAWLLMLDVPRVMPCLPGAKLHEVLDGNKYRGSVSVKLGPIKLSFDGTAELVRTDEENHIAYLQGKGLDPKGRGSASSDFSFTLTSATDGGTDVEVNTELLLSGAVAQYGRGSGMIAEVASQILGQFERNLARMVRGEDKSAPGIDSVANKTADMSYVSTSAGATGAHVAAQSTTAANSQTPTPQMPSTSNADVQILYQAQMILSQTQSLQAQMLMTLARLESRDRSKDDGGSEINMLSIGLKAVWAQIRYTVKRVFGRRE